MSSNRDELEVRLLRVRTLQGELAQLTGAHALQQAALDEQWRIRITPALEQLEQEIQNVRAIVHREGGLAWKGHLSHGSVTRRYHPPEVRFVHSEAETAETLRNMGESRCVREELHVRKDVVRTLPKEVRATIGVELIQQCSVIVHPKDGEAISWNLDTIVVDK